MQHFWVKKHKQLLLSFELSILKGFEFLTESSFKKKKKKNGRLRPPKMKTNCVVGIFFLITYEPAKR